MLRLSNLIIDVRLKRQMWDEKLWRIGSWEGNRIGSAIRRPKRVEEVWHKIRTWDLFESAEIKDFGS
jgi:hypothetical protein